MDSEHYRPHLEEQKEGKEKSFQERLQDVCERYPEFAEKIRTSLEAPQLGEYHNEGERMDSHLSLMVEVLESIKNGVFHESISADKDLQEVIRNIATIPASETQESKIRPALIDYTFFHDISKQDCLRIKLEDEKEAVDISWKAWKKTETAGKPYTWAGKLIKSISYYHKSPNGQHGRKAAKMLEGKIEPDMLLVIENHEVAYQFAKISAASYEKSFIEPGFTEEQQNFIVTASYIDTMASLFPDGKPYLGNFMNLINSRNNFLLIKSYIDKGAEFEKKGLAELKKQDKILTAQDIERVLRKE